MIRNTNRQLTRVFFILVLAMGLFGARFAYNNWQLPLDQIETPQLTAEGDWIEFVSALGEEAIQLFLGLTSDE